MSTANACVLRKPQATHCLGIYRRRRPERTVRYQARWEDPLGGTVPAYVDMIFANISRADSSPTALPAHFAMNAGMTFSLPSLVKVEAFTRRAIPVGWVRQARQRFGDRRLHGSQPGKGNQQR
jgi:hypothetical protein